MVNEACNRKWGLFYSFQLGNLRGCFFALFVHSVVLGFFRAGSALVTGLFW